jgi:hypothetical protein
MSVILIALKIATNAIGFVTSYISVEPRYIPGMLIGVVNARIDSYPRRRKP